MSHDFQNVNLTHHTGDVSLVLDLVFFKDFDGNLLLSELVDAFAHLAERAWADSLTYEVVADHAVIGRVVLLSALCGLPVATLQFVLLLFELS